MSGQLTPEDFSTFGDYSGKAFDTAFQAPQGQPDVVKLDKVKAGNVAINLDVKKGLGFNDPNAASQEDEEPSDALSQLRKQMASMAPSTKFDVTPTLSSIDGGYSAKTVDIDTSPAAIGTNIGLVSAPAGINEGQRNQEDEYFDYIDSLATQYNQEVDDTGAKAQQAGQAFDLAGDAIAFASDKGYITGQPVTSVFGKTLPGYRGQASSAQYAQQNIGNTGASSLAGQVAGAGMTIASAYSAYDALKGGIDSPMEGAQAVSGIIGTIGGLNAMGLISTPGFMAAAGPVGWALAGASLLYTTGLIGGKGKDKPPMGGVEVRLADESGKLYTTYEEGKNLKISAGAASSYNGFNSQAMKSQTQKNIDYMYAFADEFGLKVNEKAWAEAAFGPKKYLPRGRGDPYRSVLEKIDSEGDGSSSPSEWLRHAMEYQSESGERIIDGDIYKGVRIGPNGLPMKVGYKTQESFQEAVAEFNKKFYGK